MKARHLTYETVFLVFIKTVHVNLQILIPLLEKNIIEINFINLFKVAVGISDCVG